MVEDILDSVLKWLESAYGDYDFFLERDIAWTIQCKVRESIYKGHYQLKVVHEFRKFDLAILNNQNIDQVVIELKYEPDHQRANEGDFLNTKFDVCAWCDILKDIKKAEDYVSQNPSRKAVTILFDEGDYWKKKQPQAPPHTKWEIWKCNGRKPRHFHILIGRFGF